MLGSESSDDLAGSPHSIGDTQEQCQVSRFLTLPRELRDEIYHHVLGGRVFRLTFSRDRGPWDADLGLFGDYHVGELLCTTSSRYLSERRDPLELAEGEVQVSSDDFNFRGYDHIRDLKKKKRMFVGALPFLLVCRQVYNESVELLYSRNTFQFHQAYSMPDIFSYIPPNRLAAIRSLELLLEASEPLGMGNPPKLPTEELMRRGSLALKELIEPVLSAVESLFPNLRKLYLATNYKVYRLFLEDLMQYLAPESYADANEYLTVLDKFADKLSPRLEEFEFVPQRTMYLSLVRRSFSLNGGPDHSTIWWFVHGCRQPVHSPALPDVLENPRYLIRSGFNDLLCMAGTDLAQGPFPKIKF